MWFGTLVWLFFPGVSLVAHGCGLVFWSLAGVVVVPWCDVHVGTWVRLMGAVMALRGGLVH